MRDSSPPFFPDRHAPGALPSPANQFAGKPKGNFPLILPQRFEQLLTNASAADGVDVSAGGTGLMCSYSSGGNGMAEVKFIAGSAESAWIPFVQGTRLNPLPFDRLKLKWSNQAGITLIFNYWTEDPANHIE